jgi:DNA-binding NarL/FixJ family response regulator
MQVSALGLYHQNIALRAQNAALKQALARQQAASSGPRSHWATPPRDPLPAAPIPPPATAAQTGRGLTPRQRQVMALVLAGWPSKNIAADLAISQRTVENHRAAIMRRTGATSIPALARIVIGAAQSGDCMPAATRHSPAHDVPPIPAAPKASHAPD